MGACDMYARARICVCVCVQVCGCVCMCMCMCLQFYQALCIINWYYQEYVIYILLVLFTHL